MTPKQWISQKVWGSFREISENINFYLKSNLFHGKPLYVFKIGVCRFFFSNCWPKRIFDQVTYRPILHFSIFGIATYSCKYVFCSNNKSSVNLVVFPGLLLIPKEVKTTYGDIFKTISAFLVLVPHKYFPPSIYDKKKCNVEIFVVNICTKGQ